MQEDITVKEGIVVKEGIMSDTVVVKEGIVMKEGIARKEVNVMPSPGRRVPLERRALLGRRPPSL